MPYPPSPPRVGDLALWLDPEMNFLATPNHVISWRDRVGKADVAFSSLAPEA